MGGSETLGGVTVRWAVETDVGLTRSVNEDAAMAKPPVFLVADGMGGHEAGDVASSMVVAKFDSLEPNRLASCDSVVELIREANEEVFVAGDQQSRDRAMGSTAVGLVLVDQGEPCWLIFNVGDSRAYRLSGEKLELLSVDHSYVQELVDAGQIGAQEARKHPQRNVITRAFGTDTYIEPDIWIRELSPGERFLLCSDGLSGEVDEPLIRARLLEYQEPGDAARQLVKDALAAGGRDNVTVVVVDLLDADSESLGTTEPRPEISPDLAQDCLPAVDQAQVEEDNSSQDAVEISEVPVFESGETQQSPSDEEPAPAVSEDLLITGVPVGDRPPESDDVDEIEPAEPAVEERTEIEGDGIEDE